MAITNTHEKFMHELGDIYDAENQFLQAQQELAQHATDQTLKSAIQTHIQETEQQVQVLEQVYSTLGQQPERVMCHAARGLVSEAQQTLSEAQKPELRDCLIASAASKVEHYEIASYTGLIMGAQQMGQNEVVSLLEQNLQQEQMTAQLLEQTAPQLTQRAMQAEGMQPANA